MGKAKFRVSYELLQDVLNMPDGVEWLQAENRPDWREIEFTVRHDDLPETKVGDLIPLISPSVSYEWDWGISEDDDGVR